MWYIIEQIYYVYEWYVVSTNEVFYVGKGKGNRYKTTYKRNKFFTDFLNTHECDVRIVDQNLTEDEAFKKEKELIKYYRTETNNRLTNICDGGEGSSGFKMSEEQKKILSISAKKMWENEEFKKRNHEMRTGENSPYRTKEFKEKISKIVSGKKNPNYNNRWSDEQKQALSNLRKNNGLSKGKNNPMAKSIICLENGEIFEIINDAMKRYNVKHEGSFTLALKERHRTAAGFHWMEYSDKLLDGNERFKELIYSLSLSQKPKIICVESQEIYNTIEEYIKSVKISKRKYNENFIPNGQMIIENKTYMYVKDYYSRFIQ